LQSSYHVLAKEAPLIWKHELSANMDSRAAHLNAVSSAFPSSLV